MVEELKARLERYRAAEAAILKAQRYKIGDRELTRANLHEVRSAIVELESEIAYLEKKSGWQKRAVFVE